MFETLLTDWSPFAIIAKFTWLLQLALIIHVVKTGRPYWWIWILFIAPAIGGLAYLFVEVLPEMRGPRVRGGGGFLAGLKPRAWRIRDLRATLDETDTVKTRLALADELLEAGASAEAHEVAVESLQGVFRNDPHTLAAVARFKIEEQHWDEALALLERVDLTGDRMLGQTVTLLKGRALLGAQRFGEAETNLRALEGRFVGDEPRFHLAEVFDATARHDEAIAAWREILKRYRKASPAWRRSEKHWYQRAKAKLKAAGA